MRDISRSQHIRKIAKTTKLIFVDFRLSLRTHKSEWSPLVSAWLLPPKMVAVFVHSNVRFRKILPDSMRTNDRLSHHLSVENILYAKVCRDWRKAARLIRGQALLWKSLAEGISTFCNGKRPPSLRPLAWMRPKWRVLCDTHSQTRNLTRLRVRTLPDFLVADPRSLPRTICIYLYSNFDTARTDNYYDRNCNSKNCPNFSSDLPPKAEGPLPIRRTFPT